MSNLAIQVSNISKMYQVGTVQVGNETLARQMAKSITSPFRRMANIVRGKQTSAADLHERFWALSDVSFDIKHGEIVGVIGRNGAGKSTLLKLLSRITYPTKGRIALYGRVGSLLEVGTGFHSELTGRENVYMNGAILGMSRREIDSKFDEIVEFAEVERFIDTPFKHYSSGMGVRLAFSVAAHLDPEILIVDEVLAVGDISFQKKSLDKMNSVTNAGRTVIIVSHNLGVVRQLCTRAICLRDGQIVADGQVDHAIEQYIGSEFSQNGEISWAEGIAGRDVDEFKLYAVRIVNARGEVTSKLDVTQDHMVEIEYEITRRLPQMRVGFILTDRNGVDALEAYDYDLPEFQVPREPGRFITRCRLPHSTLAARSYTLSFNAGIYGIKNLCNLQNILSIEVLPTEAIATYDGNRRGIIYPKMQWNTETHNL